MKSGRVIQCQQGDETWFFERTGRVTASRVADVVSKRSNGKYTAARETYKLELLTEILTGRAAEHYVSLAMDWGVEQEPLARAEYELATNVEVERVGLVIHPSIDRAAASPDGFVGTDGLAEFKCPTTSTHLRYLIEEKIPDDYVCQMQWQLACTGRLWNDFVSYDSRLPSEFGLFIVRLDRDDKLIGQMEREVEQFISELNNLAEKLLKDRPKRERPDLSAVAAQIPGWSAELEAIRKEEAAKEFMKLNGE